jgi:hypothetical protein
MEPEKPAIEEESQSKLLEEPPETQIDLSILNSAMHIEEEKVPIEP